MMSMIGIETEKKTDLYELCESFFFYVCSFFFLSSLCSNFITSLHSAPTIASIEMTSRSRYRDEDDDLSSDDSFDWSSDSAPKTKRKTTGKGTVKEDVRRIQD